MFNNLYKNIINISVAKISYIYKCVRHVTKTSFCTQPDILWRCYEFNRRLQRCMLVVPLRD